MDFEVTTLLLRRLGEESGILAIDQIPASIILDIATRTLALLAATNATKHQIRAQGHKARLAPIDQIERARLQQWLSFTSTELHQGLFCQLFDQEAPQGTKAHALNK
jgi:hypothetical protein